MNEIEKKALELLAAEYRKSGANPAACELMAGRASWPNQMALNAIVAALTPPEGFVLVPVELPEEMEVAFMEAWASKRRCIDDPEMQDAWAAALAARPEVKP